MGASGVVAVSPTWMRSHMDATSTVLDAHPVLEMLALRGLAFVLAPILFVGVLGFALAALPAVGIRRALARS